MFDLDKINAGDKKEFYKILLEQVDALLFEERDWLANLANEAALLFNSMDRVNWAGFYLYRDQQLILGPFQGKPACIRIEIGRGVCGAAAQRKETVIVPDVHQFPGHIACDAASRSEVVVPMTLSDGRLLGVLDIDSPVKDRFDNFDGRCLEELVAAVVNGTNWPAAW